MNWQQYIHSDPDVLLGKPTIIGTRLAVDFILDLLAAGWTDEQLFGSYPRLTPEALRAIFAYAGAGIRDESLYVMPPMAV